MDITLKTQLLFDLNKSIINKLIKLPKKIEINISSKVSINYQFYKSLIGSILSYVSLILLDIIY
jgi:hypothetical protein